MLYYENLERVITDRCFVRGADELIIISGFIGPNPIENIEKKIFEERNRSDYKVSIIYGMYGSNGISRQLHSMIVPLNKPGQVDIVYSKVPVHSKIYIWKERGQIVSALIGSANFSISGVGTPFKETLAETSEDTYIKIEEYYRQIIENCIDCTDPTILDRARGQIIPSIDDFAPISFDPATNKEELYGVTLLNPDTDDVPAASGINWGQAKLNGSHVNLNDGYIPIRREDIANKPGLFPKKRTIPALLTSKGGSARDNDPVEILWDDGTRMIGLLEGVQTIDGVKYPKQISTSPSKALFGKYLRQRLGIQSGKKITKEDLENYGRSDIGIALIGEGVYYFDFSKKNNAINKA